MALSRKGKSNPVFSALLASFLALSLIYVLSIVYIDQVTLNQNDKSSLNVLYWVSIGLVAILLIWALVSYKNSSNNTNGNSEKVDSTVVSLQCNEKDECEITGISNLKGDKDGVHIMTIEKEKPAVEVEKMYSPIGNMKIKYLV
jgi:hypothetical protein